MTETEQIRVLIVEDSRVNQELLKGLLAEETAFEVIGVVSNGKEAVDFVSRNRPDVISMDIIMPLLDGLEATRLIMHLHPVPIVIVSSLYNSSEVKLSFNILEAGALTILPRPYGPGHPQYQQTARHYRHTLRVMSKVAVKAIPSFAPPLFRKETIGDDSTPTKATGAIHPVYKLRPMTGKNHEDCYKIIAIGASAGGPQVIQTILANLPQTLPVPVLIVQHIDQNFADGYAEWLNAISSLKVKIARTGESLLPGHVYLPPGDQHLGLLGRDIASVRRSPEEQGLRPAVSVLFRDVLRFYGKDSVAILLTGMGVDGAQELKLLRDAGAYTIAQDAQSALVNGMPGEAVRLDAACRILNPDEIVREIKRLFKL